MTKWLFFDSDVLSNLNDSTSLVLFSVLVIILIFLWNKKGGKNLPPGPYGLPIVGHLPLLGKEPFKTFSRYSQKYGKIFSVKYGKTPVVIIADFEVFKEACSKMELLDRPSGLFDCMPGAGGFAGSNGNIWVEQRRFTMKSVRNLGLGKSPWEVAITDEVQEFVKHLRKQEGKPTDIEESLCSSVARNVLSLVLSKPIEESSPVSKLITEFVGSGIKIIGAHVFAHHFPRYLKWLAMRSFPISKKDYETVEDFSKLLWNEVNDRKTAATYFDSGDFIGSYFQEMEKKEDLGGSEDNFNKYHLVGNMVAMFMGGSETTKTSVQWLCVAMAQHPDVQQKVYEELESFLGERKLPHWEDRSKLPWTSTSIMEAQRWRTLAPVTPTRQANEDVQVAGYDIPRGTCVEGLLWAMHNDKKYYKNPEEFNPTRFLKNDGTVNFKHESYLPFSLGRRNCPGETIALMEILIYFSALVRNFEIKPEGPSEKFHVDAIMMQTYQPAPHKLRFIPRH